MGKNKDKDKGGTGSPPVHNIIKQIFCTAEKAYCSGQTGEDTRVLDSDSGAHATPRKEIIEIKSQKTELRSPATAIAAAVGKVDIPSEGAKIPLNDVRMDTTTVCTDEPEQ
ncbi:hypothetical protein PAAG_06381 [Paracoccidioides lutzii Pb01]|uniref:Uncharacterized protein n=1 Tax=Paracoccidioides lutzii (strain ATCC MYA-826 / Pb01) TaxID=502779 RepID=C1H6J0_PARBA|nr:hypothetical protein PAAG_06381 [Paracoccidioides lutzii Pb01]EEH35334.1 hypothetical protein PAAG_06381 [Paracoccidioides lutzii Pb01]